MVMNDSKLSVLIACHKPYVLPEDACYLPVEAGAALRPQHIPGCVRDNTGENISEKNQNYCELTALYWAWKNLESDYLGLVHYRRYFSSGRFQRHIAREEDYFKALSKAPVILPKKRHYYIETNYNQYIHAHHQQDLEVTRDVLAEKFPEYLAEYDRQMRLRSGHRFNMFVMRRELLYDYCNWLFSLLFEIEKRLNVSLYDEYNARVFDFLAERLLDVWLNKNKLDFTEMPVFCTEKQHWLIKIYHFLERKMLNSDDET